MTKVGEHITLDIIGTTKEYSPEFFEKMVYRIAKLAKSCKPSVNALKTAIVFAMS